MKFKPSNEMHRVLRESFGYEALRGIQEKVVRHTLQGGNSLVLMPTGAGKSLCYQLPAMMMAECPSSATPLTLVLSPLIALMKDQVDALHAKGVDATFINSTLSSVDRRNRYEAIAEGKHRILYVTPERFRKAEFLAILEHRHIVLLAVDEAHCVSEWGHDFRPDYTRLSEFRELLGNPITMALTATATHQVQQDILDQLGLARTTCTIFQSGIARPNLNLHVEHVWGRDEKLAKIVEQMKRLENSESSPRCDRDVAAVKPVAGSGIVYFSLIRTLQEFSELLYRSGQPHLCYHGDLNRTERRSVQEAFMANACPWVLATNAFGMGVDKQDIRAVIHAEVPGSIEAYYQEIGRAGRDGLPADCSLLYESSDLETQLEFLRWSNPDADFYQRLYDLLHYETERVQVFGIDWLREKLSAKNRRDRRLETALGMLRRFNVIEDEHDLSNMVPRLPLPECLAAPEARALKLQRDQEKLYGVVQYARADNHRAFIEDYFAVPNA